MRDCSANTIDRKEWNLYSKSRMQGTEYKLGKINFTGYLAQMSYFPNWKTTSGKIEAPENETPIPINIESYFENTYDSYNDPKTGTDSRVKGNYNPHYMSFPVNYQTGRNVGSGLCTCYGSNQQRERSFNMQDFNLTGIH